MSQTSQTKMIVEVEVWEDNTLFNGSDDGTSGQPHDIPWH